MYSMYNLLIQGLGFLYNLKVVNDMRMRICVEIEILGFHASPFLCWLGTIIT